MKKLRPLLFFLWVVPAIVVWSEESASGKAAVPGSEERGPQEEMHVNSAFAELVRLVQAGVEDSVILAYVGKSLRLFQLDADDIIYLTDLGTPAEVIKAVIEHDELLIQKGISDAATADQAALTAGSAEIVEEQPEEVTEAYFYSRLAPYGRWVDIDGYGRCWRPTVTLYHSGWNPYCDNGYWVHTIHGWYWVSGYSWGSTTFHYGRWFNHARYGWCWWPDTVWAPSWVCWRYDRSYCGWAPLPPYTVYRSGIGLVYRNSRVAVGFDFGLNAGSFIFVSINNFCDPKPWKHRVDHREAERIYNRTTVHHNMDFDRQRGRISNAGIPHRDVSSATGKNIRPVSIRHVKGGIARSTNQQRSDRNGRMPAANRPDRTPSDKPMRSNNRQTVPQRQAGSRKPGTGGQGSHPKSVESKQSNPNAHRRGSPVPQAGKKQAPRTSAVRQPAKSSRSQPASKVRQSQRAQSPQQSLPQQARGKPEPKDKE